MMLEILLLVWKTQKYGGAKPVNEIPISPLDHWFSNGNTYTSINKRFKKNKHRFTSTQNACLFTLYCCFCKHE